MHFKDTQEMLRFYNSKPEDLRETQRRLNEKAEVQEHEGEEKTERPRRGRKA